MRQVSPDELLGLAADITAELEHLRHLAGDVATVCAEIESDPATPGYSTRI